MEQLISLEQQQVISLEQQQSLQILALSNQELESFLTEEYLQNPLLECERDREGEIISSLEQNYETLGTYRDHYLEFQDDDFDRRGDVRAKEGNRSLMVSITDQIPRGALTEKEMRLVPYLIQCLDDRGFFPYSAEEISAVLRCPEEPVRNCLRVLKELEPTGIFSRDISECLLAQIQKEGIGDELLKETVKRFMPELLQGKISEITRALHISTQKVREYIHQIGSLRPYPLPQGDTEETQAIIPDILVSRDHDEWSIVINDGWIGEYRYNDYYISLMRSTADPDLKHYFYEKLKRARMVVEAVERRRKTIVDIVGVILDIQSAYFLEGDSLRMMTMEQVAERLSIHPSTVSRAVRNKYLQYRRPVPLKSLFSSASFAGTDASAEKIKERIREIVRAEDREHPLSDDRIAAVLKEEGCSVSRRTIAKYRQEMLIPDSRKRHVLS